MEVWELKLYFYPPAGEKTKKKKKIEVKMTDDNGNAMFQSYLSKLFKKETG